MGDALSSDEDGVSDETGVAVGDDDLLLWGFRGVGVGNGRVKIFFNLSPSVSFSS